MSQSVPGAVRDAIVAARPHSRTLALRWRDDPVRAALDRSFADCATAEAAADVAERWFADNRWVGALLAPLVDALGRTPMLDPPLKVSRDGGRIGAILFENAVVSISASVLDAAALALAPLRTSVVASGRMSVTRYARAHRAVLRRWSVGDDGAHAVEAPPRHLADGAVVRCDGRRAAHAVEAPRHDIVQLVAHVRIHAAATMREFSIPDGRLLRAATLDDGAARSAMLLTLLRHCGRADAATAFDAASRDAASPFRWDAMREWIALDARSAWPRLAEMAADDADADIRDAAVTTLALVERKMAEAQCRA